VLPDETLVFDHDRQKGHCLNATSALVWRGCDGRTSLDVLARRLADSEAIPVAEAAEVVGLALEQLGRRGLLEQAPAPMPVERRIVRRDALKNLAFVVAMPLILTIATKAAADTLSDPADPPPKPPINVNLNVDVNINTGSGSGRPTTAAQVRPGPCRTKGQSCISSVSGQQGTCCRGLTCTGVSNNAGVCA
jgi:hypothetical protein